jgi:hypothetical protein
MSDVLYESSKRVETLLDRFSAYPPATGARTDAEEIVRVVSGLYGECLRRMVSVLREDMGEHATALLKRCCEDPLTASLLITHELHPVPLEQRVEDAISRFEGVRAVTITEELVELRVDGPADLVPKVEQAIYAAAPEVLAVRAAGATISLLDIA